MSTSITTAANTSKHPPEIGQLVVAPSRRYAAVALKASRISGAKHLQDLVNLTSVGDDNLGEELQSVWELELDNLCINSSSASRRTSR